MGSRILVTLDASADPEAVGAALRESGATDVQPPRPELPDVAVAEVPDDDDPTRAAERFAALDGVAHAEPDALRWTQ